MDWNGNDPMFLNDLAGTAIMDGRHADAALYLREAAAQRVSPEARKVLIERALEQERIATWQQIEQCPVVKS